MRVSKARELREQRKKLCEQANTVLENQALTKEERSSQFDKLMSDADGLKLEIDREERADALDLEVRNGAPPRGELEDADQAKLQLARFQMGFRSFLKLGLSESGVVWRKASAEDRKLALEFRDMGTGGSGAGIATSGGGVLVPIGFHDSITEALKYYGPMLNGGPGMPTIMDTATGQILPYPTDNDVSNTGEIVGEGQQVTQQDVTLGSINFGAFKFSTKMVKVSIELLQDSAFDIEAFLIRKFATRIGRILNNKFTVGVGVTEPYGIVTQATSAGTLVGANTNDGVSGANTIGSDDLTTLEHSVDPLYRRGALYMFNDSTLASLKKIKDKYGRPLWLPGVAVNAPDTINGYGYVINNDMAPMPANVASPPASAKTILFGDLSLYLIRRVKELAVLRLEERFADFGQVAFLGFARYDGNLLDAGTHPVKYMSTVY